MTTLTHPDGFAVDYNYDALGRVISAVEGTTTLATVAYEDYGRRSSLAYGNGTSVDYRFDGAGRLDELDWDLNGTEDDFQYDMTFTPASQLSSLTTSDASLVWSPAGTAVDDYTAPAREGAQTKDSPVQHPVRIALPVARGGVYNLSAFADGRAQPIHRYRPRIRGPGQAARRLTKPR